MSALRWTNKSTGALAAGLTGQSHPVSDKTVARNRRRLGYSMQLNQKSREGPQHQNRDQQFGYINRQVAAYRKSGDRCCQWTRRRENWRDPSKTGAGGGAPRASRIGYTFMIFHPWRRARRFPTGHTRSEMTGRRVNAVITHDTAEFAVESIRRWWKLAGSNSRRSRTWKLHPRKLADELGMAITVCHYPPGTSKWNKIEHRLFSFISLTWPRGTWKG